MGPVGATLEVDAGEEPRQWLRELNFLEKWGPG